MGVNRVEFENDVLIDLTEDTVTSQSLLNGVTAHNAAGEKIQGTFVAAPIVDDLTSDRSDAALSARQGKKLEDEKLAKTGDSKDNTATFTSGDSISLPGWTDIELISSGEKHSSLLQKLSTAVKNMRYLYKLLGTTDISNIGNGTITDALVTLNSNLNLVRGNISTDYSGNTILYIANEYMAMVSINGLKNLPLKTSVTIGTLPQIARPNIRITQDVDGVEGVKIRFYVYTDGIIKCYRYNDISPENITCILTYLK